MSDATTPHPTLRELQAFDAGRLGPEDWAEIERHIAECGLCCGQLEALPEDSLAGLMRTSVDGALSLPSADTGDAPDSVADTVAVPGRPAPSRPQVPAELAEHPRYRVLGLVGAGGMGAVFKAEHRLMERVVALKVVRKHLTANPAAVERFRQEVRAAARLAHPHIVTAHDADQAGDHHFLVMEFVEGRTLHRLVDEGGPLAVADACRWVRQAALGLEHARECGMVHRDVKPSNLLLTAAGQVKVLDFGLARFAQEPRVAAGPGGPLTGLGVVVGTPDYMAPEQARDSHRADTRADIYSLGCTLYHLLAGRPPFPEGTAVEKLLAHQGREPEPLSALRADVPPALERVLGRMLAKDPARRYQTPAEVADALAPFCPAGAESGERRGSSPPSVLPAPRRSRRRLGIAAAAAVLLAVAGAVAFVARPRPQPVAPSEDPGAVASNGGSEPTEPPVPEGDPPQREADPPGRPPDPPEPEPAAVVLRCLEGHEYMVISAAFAPDGRLAATGGLDNDIRIWGLAAGKCVQKLEGHSNQVRCVTFSPDGQRLLSASADGSVRLWHVKTGTQLKMLAGHTDVAQAVAFAPDGKRAISGGYDNTVRVWDLEKGRLIHTLKKHEKHVVSVVFAPDGVHALSASHDGLLLLWDTEAGESRHEFEHPHAVTSVVLSADGRYALAGCWDNRVHLWNVAKPKYLGAFEGHTEPVFGVALSPDGRYLLSAARDKTVRLWEVASGCELFCFQEHTGEAHTVQFAPDGRTALSGGVDKAALWWKPPLPKEPWGPEHPFPR